MGACGAGVAGSESRPYLKALPEGPTWEPYQMSGMASGLKTGPSWGRPGDGLLGVVGVGDPA